MSTIDRRDHTDCDFNDKSSTVYVPAFVNPNCQSLTSASSGSRCDNDLRCRWRFEAYWRTHPLACLGHTHVSPQRCVVARSIAIERLCRTRDSAGIMPLTYDGGVPLIQVVPKSAWPNSLTAPTVQKARRPINSTKVAGLTSSGRPGSFARRYDFDLLCSCCFFMLRVSSCSCSLLLCSLALEP